MSTIYVVDDGDYDDDESGEPESGEPEFDCGEMRDGGCSLAGTEECDWVCPFNDWRNRKRTRKAK